MPENERSHHDTMSRHHLVEGVVSKLRSAPEKPQALWRFMDGNCLVRSEGEKTVSNTLKDDALTQDSRLADCRGAEDTVKVAVGPKTCSRNARTIQQKKACSSTVNLEGEAYVYGPTYGPQKAFADGHQNDYLGPYMSPTLHVDGKNWGQCQICAFGKYENGFPLLEKMPAKSGRTCLRNLCRLTTPKESCDPLVHRIYSPMEVE